MCDDDDDDDEEEEEKYAFLEWDAENFGLSAVEGRFNKETGKTGTTGLILLLLLWLLSSQPLAFKNVNTAGAAGDKVEGISAGDTLLLVDEVALIFVDD
jgi:hypothetical protein